MVGGDLTAPSPGYYQNNFYRGWDNMISYMVGKVASNLTHFTRSLVKSVPGRDIFVTSPPKLGGKKGHPPPPHTLLNDSKMLVVSRGGTEQKYLFETCLYSLDTEAAHIRYR